MNPIRNKRSHLRRPCGKLTVVQPGWSARNLRRFVQANAQRVQQENLRYLAFNSI
jgi:hypothetical protein